MLNTDFNLEEPKHKHSSGNLLRNINLGRFDKRWELLIFPLICMLASWLALSQTLQVNLWVLIGVIAIPIAIASFYRPDLGLLCMLSIAFFLPGLEKIAGFSYARLSFDILWIVNIVGTFLYIGRSRKISIYSNPLANVVAVWIGYNMVFLSSHIGGDPNTFWTGLEKYVLPGCMFWVGLFALEDLKRIRLFTHFLLGLGVLVALYGWIQGFTGISMRESSELFANPSLYESYFINGRFRIDSFFTNPSQLGMVMASLSVFAYANLLGPWKRYNLLAYLLALPLLAGAMVLSRTTSAYLVVGMGLLLFLTLSLKRHPLWSLFCLMIVGASFYALNFLPLLKSVVPPIVSSEMGGYSQLLQESGWVGLILFTAILAMTCWSGIQGFSKSIDVRVKHTYLVYLAAMGVWIIGHYYSPILHEIPMSIVLFLSAAVLVNLKKVERDSP